MNTTNETMEYAAMSCARKLADWFGDADKAAQALKDDPVAMVAIALESVRKDMRSMTNAALRKPEAFSRALLEML